MPALDFTGQSALDDDNKTANTSRLINVFRQSGETGATLQTVLGTELVDSLPSASPTALGVANEKLFFTSGNSFYESTSADTVILRATIPYDVNTMISSNNEYCVINSNGVMYSWDSDLNILRTLDAASFTAIGSTCFLGQRTFSSQLNGRQFQWSELIDPTNVDGLSFATAESKDDRIVRLGAVNGLLWIFGTNSIERWYLTGGVDVIAPVAGGTIERGIKNFQSYISMPQGAAFIGTDNRVYIVDSQTIVPISTPAVESTISNSLLFSALTYNQDGNQFLCWIFDDRPAWCYNITTGEWNERASGNDAEWNVRFAAECYGSQYALSKTSSLLRLVDNFDDFDQPLIRSATSRTLAKSGESFIVRFLELLSVPGSIEGLGRTPVISLEMSIDRGRTWSQPQYRAFGAGGDYNNRIKWRALGRFPAFVTARLSWSDPVNLPVESTVWVEVV